MLFCGPSFRLLSGKVGRTNHIHPSMGAMSSEFEQVVQPSPASKLYPSLPPLSSPSPPDETIPSV